MSTAAGIADCLIPKARPWRSIGTWSAMNRLMAGCATALARPATDEAGEERQQRIRREPGRQQADAGDERAAEHRAQRARALREPPARAGADRARQEEDAHAGGHRLDAHVEVAADLQRQCAHEEAGQHGHGPGRDREQ